MKMVFLAATFTTVWYMSAERVVKQTYDKEHDTFRILFLIIPSFFLALLVHHRFTVMEVCMVHFCRVPAVMRHVHAAQVLWTFSIYLEAVAILPQLVLLQRTQNVDNMTGNWIFLLGCVTVHACPICSCVCNTITQVVSCALPAQLDIPLLDRTGVQAVAGVAGRHRADRSVC